MISWLWYIVSALHMASLVADILNGAPTSEHEAPMLLALVLAKVDAPDQRRRAERGGEDQ